ncbi:glyoxylase-like metal-dependent hydrolase (beta-lactamase superfamily II) [Methanohalophilus levihalophilus]|uniref:MBL fold metallo-hydrolase n=1 Tax=Methanohalophilus levihalophilus TaxID=1431282 RepID=UPI001AE1EE55|nr:MBL fold metallo-hydrolase [Methanohalophilus levihalophilus]MBP2029823.1 glyoxylase-like metal-dependent hydrolase (beta-lactamase superfamily II) [Methanohalophilus levihalophilus]
MEVTKFTTSQYNANSYLVNGKILIDTSIDTERLIKLIEEKIPIEQIELIILTHCHYDHTASVPEIVKKSGAKVGIHKLDGDCVMDTEKSVSYLFGKEAPEIVANELYEDGDTIDIGSGEKLKIIHTPGHTRGGICLYERNSKSLFSGDTVFSSGGFGRTDFEGGSREKITESIGKIAELDVETLYPGHGPVTSENANHHIQLSHRASRSMW